MADYTQYIDRYDIDRTLGTWADLSTGYVFDAENELVEGVRVTLNADGTLSYSYDGQDLTSTSSAIVEATVNEISGSITTNSSLSTSTAGLWTDRHLRLFGAPYQFTRAVDPLYNSAFEYMGRSYGENIMARSCIVTLIPGKPYYLPGEGSDIKNMTSNALITNSTLKNALGSVDTSDVENMRYYDFQTSYYEYMNYVNLLCRSLAMLLDLDSVHFSDQQDGENFNIDNTAASEYSWDVFMEGGDETYRASNVTTSSGADYSDGKATYSTLDTSGDYTTATAGSYITTNGQYKYVRNSDGTYCKYSLSSTGEWIAASESSSNSHLSAEYIATKVLGTSVTTDSDDTADSTEVDSSIDSAGTFGSTLAEYVSESLSDVAMGARRYVQFYIDPDSAGSQEQHSNATTESTLKSTIDSVGSSFKELAFVMNSGGMDTMADAASSAYESIATGISSALSSTDTDISSALSRVLNLSTNVVNGENIIIPKIYESSAFGQTYSFTVHLKALYGSKVGWFWDVGVPLMHLLAFAIPKQATANTYSSPFLIKAYVDGVYSCNLGIVNSLEINKSVSSTSWTVDGLPNEIDVTVTLEDLYSDLSIDSTTQPTMFYYNTSLVDYLAVTCGLSLVTPNLALKASLYAGTLVNSITGIPKTVSGAITDAIDATIQNSILSMTYFG